MENALNILDFNIHTNTWMPPEVYEEEMAYSMRNDVNALQSDEYLYIFKTEPYIDSLYIEYDSERTPVFTHRFVFHEDYLWDRESELLFNDHCINPCRCSTNAGMLDIIYKKYSLSHPEWHLKRYLTKGLRLLDHIYNCILRNTAKELLYKSGLDELAITVYDIDEINLLAKKPSDIYGGLSIKLLKNFNCKDGAVLLNKKRGREYIRELNAKFPHLFKDKLNDAQCRYIYRMMIGDLTVEETGRLFNVRKEALSKVWSRSGYEVYMAKDFNGIKSETLINKYGAIDPIYAKYIKKIPDVTHNYTFKSLEYYLMIHRDEYDRAIKRSNRKRDYSLQERNGDYVIRFPQTANDFCREAIYMQNCLLTYMEPLIKNDTTILFLRKADDVNKPFITIEIFSGKRPHLTQAFHRFNTPCTNEEWEWINEYCDRHNIMKREEFGR